MSAVEQNGRLWLLVRGTDSHLYEGYIERDAVSRDGNGGAIDPHWQQVSTEAIPIDAPTIATYKQWRLYLYLGPDGQQYLGVYDTRGTSNPWSGASTVWSYWNRLNGSGRPSAIAGSMAVLGDRIYFNHRGSGGDNGMYLGYYDCSNGNWSSWTKLQGAVEKRPMIGTFLGHLWGIHDGTDAKLYMTDLTSYPGALWGWNTGGYSTFAPSMTEFWGQLWVINRNGKGQVEYGAVNADWSFTSWRQVGGVTDTQPSIVSFNNRLYGIRTAPSGNIYIKDLTP